MGCQVRVCARVGTRLFPRRSPDPPKFDLTLLFPSRVLRQPLGMGPPPGLRFGREWGCVSVKVSRVVHTGLCSRDPYVFKIGSR